MRGGELRIDGSAGLLVACEMAGGLLHVGGDVGDFAASTLPGSMDGMRGGSLVGLVPHSELAGGATAQPVGCVMEIVIDGLTEADVGAAMRAGMDAAIALGPAAGLLRISAGNYGGKLGPFPFHLHRLLGGAGDPA